MIFVETVSHFFLDDNKCFVPDIPCRLDLTQLKSLFDLINRENKIAKNLLPSSKMQHTVGNMYKSYDFDFRY